MEFEVGQGVFGKIPFKDGEIPAYKRVYLVVGVTDDYIEVLNISSTQGKERKLAYRTNKKLEKYCPPFDKPSFVKLDSLTRVDKQQCKSLKILFNGEKLDALELAQIIEKIIK